VKVPLETPEKNLLLDLAREFEHYLRQSEPSTVEPWQQEIREYVRSGRMPTFFARNNLAEWGRRRRLPAMSADAPAPQKRGDNETGVKAAIAPVFKRVLKSHRSSPGNWQPLAPTAPK
jgi:hypothetical protein